MEKFKIFAEISRTEVLTYSRRKTRAAKPGELRGVKSVQVRHVEARNVREAVKLARKLLRDQRYVVVGLPVAA